MKATLVEAKPMEEEEREAKVQEDRAKKRSGGFHSHLELSLGISLSNSNANASTNGEGLPGPRVLATQDGLMLHQRSGLGPAAGSKRWLSETGCAGFVHPWSLAARQEKAALEQAHQKPNPNLSSSSLQRVNHPLPPVVGWPPVRTFRRNLAGAQPAKPEMESEDDGRKSKTLDGENTNPNSESKATMFVKVNMEGYAVGRKIDLKARDSYDSLSLALQKMFQNFLSANVSNSSNKDDQLDSMNSNYILLYEDNEGDRMLVGDVPWEMFIASVKRLYIAHDPRAPKTVDGGMAEEQH